MVAVASEKTHALVMRQTLAGAFVLMLGGGSAGLPEADLVLVPDTVVEVEGCFVFTYTAYNGAEEKLVAFGFTCSPDDLSDPDWIYTNGMGIGIGDCVEFGAGEYCVEWIAVGKAAGFSRRGDPIAHARGWLQGSGEARR